MKPVWIENEHYLFLCLYQIDLITAMGVVETLKHVTDGRVRLSLFRDIIVTYARPFSGNRGRTTSKHRLKRSSVPTEYRGLHDTLIRYRQTLFAHSDLKAYNPRVSMFEAAGEMQFPMTFWLLDYDTLEECLPELESLIQGVYDALEVEIERIQSTLRKPSV